MYKKEWAVIGILIVCTAFVITSFIYKKEKSKEAEAPVVKVEELVEIKEGALLDTYGFDRNQLTVSEKKVKKNESLYLILRSLDVSPVTIHEINQKSKGVFKVSNIQPGQRYLTYADKESGTPVRLVFHENPLEYVIIDWETDVKVESGQKAVTTELMEASGEIRSSLYETLLEVGKSTLLGNRLSDVFAWQIDFFRLYPGDNFRFIYEQHYVDGEPYAVGKILAADFVNKGRKYEAYFFKGEETEGYYDENGNSVQKALLKAPFKYSQRVSSRFSHNRFHPVLKRNIPHYGVDYAAPLGTPVLSVGDGIVEEAQYRGANGNIAKIKHNGTYTTAYLHLNGFAKGIKKGARVKQGQVIGYVGKTGRVTGVHLDYRIYKNGNPVNPLKVDLPPSKSVAESDREKFFEDMNQLRMQLEEVNKQNAASVASAG